jgi:hypothetical protein
MVFTLIYATANENNIQESPLKVSKDKWWICYRNIAPNYKKNTGFEKSSDCIFQGCTILQIRKPLLHNSI